MGTPEITRKHFLSIKLNQELFAIDVKKVLEVLEKQNITRIPNVPNYLKGVINFRGEILPVIEAREKFSMPNRDSDKKFVIIVLELKRPEKTVMLGLIVDAVNEVLEIDMTQIKEVPEIGNNFNGEYLHGMVRIEVGFIMLLNVEKVFSTEEMSLIIEAQTTEQNI